MEDPVRFLLTAWHWHPDVLIGLVLLEGAYLLGIGPLRRRYRWAEGVSASQIVLFTLGVYTIFFALTGPIHELADNFLLSAHMVQHLLLTLVAAPLLLVGMPRWLLSPLARFPSVIKAGRFLTSLVPAAIASNAIIAVWHLPELYDLALRQHGIHIIQHLMFLASGVIMWWPILSPTPDIPRLSYPMQMIYLFVLSLIPAVIGSFITFSAVAIYPFYVEAPRLWGMSALLDQQIAGLIMKILGGIVLWIVATIIFFTWFHREESSAKIEPNS